MHIDSYHLWVDDEYAFGGETRGIYNEDDPMPDSRRYLTKEERQSAKEKNEGKEVVLSLWWNMEKGKKGCEEGKGCEKLVGDKNYHMSFY